MNISRLALFAFGALCLPGVLSAQTELIPNDKFSDGGASWTLKVSPDASATMSVEDDAGEQALCVEVSESPEDGKTPDVRIQRLFGMLDAEKNYHVTFQLKSASPAAINPYIYPQNEGAKVLWRTTVNLEPEWKEFSFTFKGGGTADNCVLGFAGLGKTGNKYWLKDVVLTSD